MCILYNKDSGYVNSNMLLFYLHAHCVCLAKCVLVRMCVYYTFSIISIIVVD